MSSKLEPRGLVVGTATFIASMAGVQYTQEQWAICMHTDTDTDTDTHTCAVNKLCCEQYSMTP